MPGGNDFPNFFAWLYMAKANRFIGLINTHQLIFYLFPAFNGALKQFFYFLPCGLSVGKEDFHQSGKRFVYGVKITG